MNEPGKDLQFKTGCRADLSEIEVLLPCIYDFSGALQGALQGNLHGLGKDPGYFNR